MRGIAKAVEIDREIVVADIGFDMPVIVPRPVVRTQVYLELLVGGEGGEQAGSGVAGKGRWVLFIAVVGVKRRHAQFQALFRGKTENRQRKEAVFSMGKE